MLLFCRRRTWKSLSAVGSSLVKVYYDVGPPPQLAPPPGGEKIKSFGGPRYLPEKWSCWELITFVKSISRKMATAWGRARWILKRVKSTLDKNGLQNWIIMEGALANGAAFSGPLTSTNLTICQATY